MVEHTFNHSLNNILIGRLSQFELYKPENLVHVLTKGSDIYIGYHEKIKRRFSETGFDLQIDTRKGICDILYFSISEDKRRRKYGTTLYSLIESFCFENLGSRNFITSASGEAAKEFWEKMGFRYFDEERFAAQKFIDYS